MRSLFFIIAISSVLAIGAVSCSKPATEDAEKAANLTPVPPPTSPTPAQSSVPPLPTETPAAAPETQAPAPAAPEAPAEPAQPVHNSNLAPNGSFEVKDESGRPRGWAVSPIEILAKAEGDAPHGDDFIALQGVEESWGIVSCNLAVPEVYSGKPLRVEAWAKAPQPDALRISVICEDKGQEVELVKKLWPESSTDWSKIEFVVTVPKTATKDSAKLKVLLPQGADPGFALDNIRVTADLLGANTSLDEVDDSGRPRGWIVAPSDIISSENTTPYDGSRALTYKGTPDSFGIVAHDITIDKTDVGKTLVVSVWGKSNDPKGLKIAFEAKRSGETATIGGNTWVPGEAWSQGVARAEIPADIDFDTLQLRILSQPGSDTEHAIDLVQASLE